MEEERENGRENDRGKTETVAEEAGEGKAVPMAESWPLRVGLKVSATEIAAAEMEQNRQEARHTQT